MCGPRYAVPSTPRQNVFFRRAPHASTGCRKGSSRRDPARDVAARPADDNRRARDDARHRVVAARVDVAIVQEEQVGDAGEPVEGFVVPVGERLLRQVARRHDQRAPGGGQQQVMQRACTAA